MNQRVNIVSMAKGLANNEFLFYFQPIISLATGKICGAESLLRWNRGGNKIISPGEFIPLAEKSGFITEITSAILPKLLIDINKINMIDPTIFISFNVSSKDFIKTDFLKTLASATTNNPIVKQNLFIEITETAFLPGSKKIFDTLDGIAEQGISIVLNDFSAGHATLSNLTNMPIKTLKLDMKLVQKMPKSRADFRLFRHLVSMAHQLGLDIVAEGIEDKEMHTMVLSSGCTHAQGYYYYHPLPLENFLQLIEKNASWVKYPFGLEYLAQFDLIDFRRDIIRAALTIFTSEDPGIQNRALNRLPALSVNDCLISRWIEIVQAQNDMNSAFHELLTAHNDFHRLADEIIRVAKNHSNRMKLEKLIIEFSEKSEIIINLVQKMEIERLKDYFFEK